MEHIACQCKLEGSAENTRSPRNFRSRLGRESVRSCSATSTTSSTHACVKMTKPQVNNSIVAVKSKFDADIIRFSISLEHDVTIGYEAFRKPLAEKHGIGPDLKFGIWYTDPTNHDLLPITNDSNLARAFSASKPLLKIFIQRQGEGIEDASENNAFKQRNFITSILGNAPAKPRPLAISKPQNFRQVSAIIDVDLVPATCRRVRIIKHGMDKPLGFYVKEGDSYRVHPNRGIEKITGVFISRVVPGGLAEATGLLAVNDEVLEVNGIDVAEKTLDQVTDMMIANSSNLIITVKPANQMSTLPRRGSYSRSSQVSSGSQKSAATRSSDEDVDEIVDLTTMHLNNHDDDLQRFNDYEEVTHL